MIYQQEFVVGPYIRNGFEALATQYGFAITHIAPEPDEKHTRYTLEGTDEHDFEKFTDEMNILYQSGWGR